MAKSASVSTPKNPIKKRYPHSFWWYLKLFFNGVLLLLFCGIVAILAVGKDLYDRFESTVVDINVMTQRTKTGSTKIWSAPGTGGKRVLLAELKGDKRQWIPIENLKVTRQYGGKDVRVPGRLIDATLSIEDARFYTHPGMDIKRILGAARANFRAGSSVQGGSTITEQLAVNLFLKRDKDLGRRLKTAMMALQLERRFSKDEILEMYLNEIPYGNRAEGCEAAARLYFDKSAADLSIAEAALMAGLPQGPGRLNPFEHFDRAKKRQELVLRGMLQNGKVNYTQYLQAKKDASVESAIARSHERMLAGRRSKERWIAPHFVSYVKQFLEKKYNYTEDTLNNGALDIYTTLDPQMQQAAEQMVRRRLQNLGGGRKLQAALVCIDPWTGGILTMVGGRDYYDTANNGEWNRAAQAKRQSGSTFKPYVYAAAMEQGYTPNSIVIDSPLRVRDVQEVKRGGHEVKNYDFRYRGAMPFYKAIGISDNVAATRVLLKVGIPTVVEKAHLMGIESPLVPYPSLALGTSEISLLENTSAFGVFATRGLRAEETPIDHVNGPDGQTVIETEKPVRGARVLSQEAGDKMWQMLRYVVTNGTGQQAQISGVDVIGKTGTTSSNKDVWFMGATKQLSCGVWIGYDRPSELYGSSGGKWSAPLWRNFMVQALETWRQRNIVASMIEDARATSLARSSAQQTKKYVSRRICDESGMIALAGCSRSHNEQFSAAGDIPNQVCDIPAHVERTQQMMDKSGAPQPGDIGYNANGYKPNDDDPSERGATARAESQADQTGLENQRDQSNGINAGATDTRTDDYAPPADGTLNSDGTRSRNSGNRSPDGITTRRENISSRMRRDKAANSARPIEYSNPSSGETSDSGNEVLVRVCADSGERATSLCPVTVERFFAPADVPKQFCTIHRRR